MNRKPTPAAHQSPFGDNIITKTTHTRQSKYCTNYRHDKHSVRRYCALKSYYYEVITPPIHSSCTKYCAICTISLLFWHPHHQCFIINSDTASSASGSISNIKKKFINRNNISLALDIYLSLKRWAIAAAIAYAYSTLALHLDRRVSLGSWSLKKNAFSTYRRPLVVDRRFLF